ncbi:MAG: YtxH domain-containing protein [Dehalococcoidia bacterium]
MGNSNNGGPGFSTGLLIGGLTGFLIGILVAPKSGEETRAIIVDRGKEWRDQAEDLSTAARERLASATSEGRRAASQSRGQSLDFDDLDLDDEAL